MPELPEVEAFRKILLPLVSKTQRLNIRRVTDTSPPGNAPPKKVMTDDEIALLHENCYCIDVVRKGKLLCMILECIKPIQGQARVFLLLHMGMTGRLSSPTLIPKLMSLDTTSSYPPPYTHLTFSVLDKDGAVSFESSYSDPRKFGSVLLAMDQDKLDELAPDAHLMNQEEQETAVSGLVEQKRSIKAILLKQKDDEKGKGAVSGVGNWVADEVLYQCQMHPHQTFLRQEEARDLIEKLKGILQTAVDCLANDESFPADWLFDYRWAKKKAGVKDAKGHAISFVVAGGRTSAIVPSIQKLRARTKKENTTSDKPQTLVAQTKPAKGSKRKAQEESTVLDKPTRPPRRKTRSSS